MFGILARLLEVLYSIWPSYGGSIVLFTLVVMLVLTPLTLKGTRSMLAMQALQPEMKKLQNRYKDDRAKLNEEMMKFYKENKISPLGGCLPMLIQLPIFFILYEVLLNLTPRGPFGQDLGASISCQLANGVGCVNGVFTSAGYFSPKHLQHTSRLYYDLTHTRTMSSWGLDLSQSPLNALGSGIAHALPYILMVVVVVALTYIQQVQIQSRAPKNATNPTQQMMMKFMPVIMGVIYLVIPAGVVIYFLVSSLFRIGQQALVTRTFYTGPNAMAIPVSVEEDVPTEKKPFWKQFIPEADSLPQTGKRKPAGGYLSKETDESPASPKKASPASKKTATTPKKKKVTSPSEVPEEVVEPVAPAVTSPKAPSRAPTRRAPSSPNAAAKKKKK